VKPLLERLLSPVRRRLAGAVKAMPPSPDGARAPTHAGTGISLEDLRVESKGPVETERLPRVAIIIPNHNGRHHLARCFASLTALHYPKD